MTVGFGHFGGAFGFSLFGEEVCFGLGFDGFGVLGFGVEGSFCFFGGAVVWIIGENVWLILAVCNRDLQAASASCRCLYRTPSAFLVSAKSLASAS